MKRSSKIKSSAAAVAGSALAASVPGAHALTSTFSVSVEFFDPFVASTTTSSSFGRIMSGVATTYSMDFNGNITPGAGGSSTGGTPTGGVYTLSDSSTGGNVDVIVDNPIDDGGVSIIAFDCDWGTGAFQDNGATCLFNNVPNPGGAGSALRIGFDIFVDGTQEPMDVARPSFDVTINYE